MTSSRTTELVLEWDRKVKRVANLEAQLQQAKGELRAATNELGAWLSPDDAKVGEQFQLWFGSGILQTCMKQSLGEGSEYTVAWRKKPDDKQAREMGLI